MGQLKVLVAGGLTVGNFIFQMIGDQLWAVALERSFFQVSGITAAYFVARCWNASTSNRG